MITTYNAYFDIHGDYQALLICIKELGDKALLRKFLTMASTISGNEITKYARIVQKIAISKSRMDLVDDLQMAHLIN